MMPKAKTTVFMVSEITVSKLVQPLQQQTAPWMKYPSREMPSNHQPPQRKRTFPAGSSSNSDADALSASSHTSGARSRAYHTHYPGTRST